MTSAWRSRPCCEQVGYSLDAAGTSPRRFAALQASAAEGRAQTSLIQLGRTLAVLADTARAAGETPLWQEVQAERCAVVERIGPEVQRLPWTADVGTRASAVAGKGHAVSPGALAVLTRREQEVAAL